MKCKENVTFPTSRISFESPVFAPLFNHLPKCCRNLDDQMNENGLRTALIFFQHTDEVNSKDLYGSLGPDHRATDA